MSVAGVLPAVARNFVGAANSAGREHDSVRPKNQESAALAIVTECADDAITFLEQRQNRPFHVNIDPLMDAVVLQRPNHFQSGAIADMRETRITVAAEIALQNPAVFRPFDYRAPP